MLASPLVAETTKPTPGETTEPTPGETPTKLSRRYPDSPAAEGQPMLAFVHIPRTGGGSLSTAISQNYSRLQGPGNYQRNPEKTRDAVARLGSEGVRKAIGDHVPYGLYVRHLPDDTRYITVLREPVDRVLSHYHFHAQAGSRPDQGARKLRTTWQSLLNMERVEREGGEQEEQIVLDPETDTSLEEGLRRKIPIYDNFMTRFLWGGESLFGELPPDALERAKENISKFWFVGFRERLDDSIILLGRKLGVGLMPYGTRHVSQKRPPLEETSEELRELVAEHNAMDVELYRFAREQFESTAPAPDELAADVDELRRVSVAVTAEREAHRATKKDRKTAKRAAHADREAQRALRKAERAGTKKEKRAKEGEAEGTAVKEPKPKKEGGRTKERKPRTDAATPAEPDTEAGDEQTDEPGDN